MRIWKNSKYVKEGDIFLVDKNNEKFVSEAVKNKASMIVTETNNTYNVKTIKVNSINEYIKNYYNLKDIKLIGITGTNGKTTTCYLIYQMLNFIGIKAAYIGTIGFYMDNKIINLDNTTPSIDILYNLIYDAKQNDCEVVVMEVSSHALKQNRVYGLLFDAIAVTNITRDHMDYHKTKKDYINSKRKIIKMLKNNKICILNSKDKYYKRFINSNNRNYIIGKDIKIKKIKMNINNTYVLFKDKNKRKIKLSLVGIFNVYNFLMAYEIIKKLGYDYKKILYNSNIFTEPLGRMQKIEYKKNVIFIDYAHTPDAVHKVLKTFKKIKNNGIITIIGCGGNRDKDKRPIMAKMACKGSNYVIFTNDNPRLEDEEEIMKDILKGAKGNYKVIYDRYDAIKYGVNLLDNKNILMILGKGHENYQIIGSNKYYFSDIDSVNKIISELR